MEQFRLNPIEVIIKISSNDSCCNKWQIGGISGVYCYSLDGTRELRPNPLFIGVYLFLDDIFGHYSTVCCNVNEVDSSS